MSVPHDIACDALESYIDGELSSAESGAFDRHLATCAACQTLIERQLQLRTRLRADLARPTAGSALQHRILSSLPAAPQPRAVVNSAGRRQWMAMAVAASCAAVIASSTTFYLVRPDSEDEWPRAILAAHLRATLSDHVIDVASSDRHTVKPWFGGKTAIAPIVVDLTSAGYPLLGGRLDIPQREALPVLVYKVGRHVASVFVRTDEDAAGSATAERIDGFSVLNWSDRGLTYSAVSDADASELAAFQRAFAASIAQMP